MPGMTNVAMEPWAFQQSMASTIGPGTPFFWEISGVGEFPNPDPTDTGDYDPSRRDSTETAVDAEFEAGRAELKCQAPEWAGLEQNSKAELLVFVGRWSMQKGIDLIADVAPQLLKENKNLQLLCVGPVIDLYGKFAAMKLQRLMEVYPGRVYSEPEFTSLPPFIFRYYIRPILDAFWSEMLTC